jgi:threonine dehydratase
MTALIVILSVLHWCLSSGVAAYVKAVCPAVRVIGVEAQGAEAMTLSLQQGKYRQPPLLLAPLTIGVKGNAWSCLMSRRLPNVRSMTMITVL